MAFKALIRKNRADVKIKADNLRQLIAAAFRKAGTDNNNCCYYQDKQCQ
jgi:hypothetical protein